MRFCCTDRQMITVSFKYTLIFISHETICITDTSQLILFRDTVDLDLRGTR